MNYYVVEDSTGKILRTGTCGPSDFHLQAREGETAREGTANDALQYELDGVLTERPAMGVTQDKATVVINETVTFANIPPGTDVLYEDQQLRVDDGVLKWSASTPGIFGFRFVNFPYQQADFRIEVQ